VLLDLWRRRARAPFGSREWIRLWGRRAATLPALLRMAWRIARLRDQGARIGAAVALSPCVLDGDRARLGVGSGTSIGRAWIQLHAAVEIGECVAINDGVRLLTGSHAVDDPAWSLVARPIRIGDHAWIATGAMILPGVTIGARAVVGAGAVVANDVPEGAVVAGNPAVVVRQRALAAPAYVPSRNYACIGAWLGR
jgi:maltose O-acetyltransferase